MIYVNQAGYSEKSKKHATITSSSHYKLLSADGRTVKEGDIALSYDENCEQEAGIIDFSDVTEAGTYYFTDAGGNKSCSFAIGNDHYDEALRASMKMFYFQRCGMELEEKYAGRFKRKACHLTDAFDLLNPERKIKMRGGWHDAGDFGRYVTPAAVALGHLLYGFELEKKELDIDINIPESGGIYPDILAECKYELDWMLQMQEEDGGVHHKATSMNFCDFIMPSDDELPITATPVSSLATADFAAVMMLAARVYKEYDEEYAGVMKAAALKSWKWLVENPSFVFENPKEVLTGTYADRCDADERFWAAAEVYRSEKDKDAGFYIFEMMELKLNLTALGWSDVGGFASLCIFMAGVEVFGSDLYNRIKLKWIDEADRLKALSQSSAFGLTLRPHEFTWGSNMVVLTNAMILCYAYELSNDRSYLDAAEYQLDYLFGRNAMDVSYVTGIGEKAFRDPHNRPGIADGIDDPIPGFVSGGPNYRPSDEAANLKNMADRPAMCRYADDKLSYSTNEITIYWNSPLVFVLGYIKKRGGYR